MVDNHIHLESRGIALRVSFVAPMGLNNEFEAFVRLAGQKVTESVGVAGNVTKDSQLLLTESDAFSLQKYTFRTRGTQGDGKSFVVENACNDRGDVGLQNFSIMDNVVS